MGVLDGGTMGSFKLDALPGGLLRLAIGLCELGNSIHHYRSLENVPARLVPQWMQQTALGWRAAIDVCPTLATTTALFSNRNINNNNLNNNSLNNMTSGVFTSFDILPQPSLDRLQLNRSVL